MSNLLNSIPRTADRLGVSRTTIYKEANAGRLRFVKVGRRSFITEDETQRYIRLLEKEARERAKAARPDPVDADDGEAA